VVCGRVPGAFHALAQTLLDPGVDAERVAAMADALASAERIQILRLVASAWPDAVPRATLRRIFGVEHPENLILLERAGLLKRERIPGPGGRPIDALRFVEAGADSGGK